MSKIRPCFLSSSKVRVLISPALFPCPQHERCAAIRCNGDLVAKERFHYLAPVSSCDTRCPGAKSIHQSYHIQYTGPMRNAIATITFRIFLQLLSNCMISKRFRIRIYCGDSSTRFINKRYDERSIGESVRRSHHSPHLPSYVRT
jgi:hypothetical protein